MFAAVLTTNGGPHSPEKWAIVTAGQIIQVAATAIGVQAMDARKLENKIIDILEKHHGKVQTQERGKIKTHGDERLSHALDPTEYIDTALDEIVAAAKGMLYEPHFSKPETRDYLRNLLGQHFATNMHIERSWHADRNPHSEHAKAFRKLHQGA